MTASSFPAPATRANPFERLLALRIPLTSEVAAYAVLFVAGFALRFWDLGSRAYHHDESIHAQWSWKLIQGDYTHSPVFHGPFYYHFQGALFGIFGANDYTGRLSPALAGLGILLLPLLLRRWLGPAGTLAAVAFIAFSPTVVYYSRFMREDIFMAFFVLLLAVAMWRYFSEGRERWLIFASLGFTGGVTTKEGMFLTMGIFLVYLMFHVAGDLTRDTARMRFRQLRATRDSAADQDDPELGPRPMLGSSLEALAVESTNFGFVLRTVFLVPVVLPIVCLWPFLRGLRERMGWDELPRSADLLILIGTLTVPLLLTPLLRVPLESLGVVNKDIALADGRMVSRLDWNNHLQFTVSRDDGLLLAGLFLLTTSATAFVGLQWRPRIWLICFGMSAAVYLALMTSFFTNPDGFISGPWGSIDYWRGEQSHGFRGDQPWYYYYILMPAYEFLPLIIAVVGAYWAVFRGTAFSRFLVTWVVGQWLLLSWASEKMPWNNTHIAVPTCILAAWVVNHAYMRIFAGARRPQLFRELPMAAVLGAGMLVAIVLLPNTTAYNAVRVVITLLGAFAIAYLAGPYGRRAVGAFAIAALIGGLSFFSIRTMYAASFQRGDIPKDLLVYTQSSPDIPRIMNDISRLAEATGKGRNLPIAVDATDSFAWPWAWYLRDYKCVAYPDLTNGIVGTSNCQGEEQPYAVVLVNRANISRVEDWAAQNQPGYYTPGQAYPHRWWFNENYKDAVKVTKGQACTAQFGNCGPFRPKTWSTLAEGVFERGWLKTWYSFWRYHDPDRIIGATGPRSCNSCGSVDASAYFPAAFDRTTGRLSTRTIEPPRPGVDAAGRPTFGGPGTQAGNLAAPSDIEVDAAGNLYVIDHQRRKLQKFDKDGNILGSVDIRKNPADAGEQSEPWGLGLLPDGRVVVADTFGWRIRIFDRDLKPTEVTFGQPPSSTSLAPGPYDLFGPRDIIVDSAGQIWVTDTGNGRIVIYTDRGEFVRAIGTKGPGPGQFDEPVGLAIAPDGTVYVADMYNARVVVLDAQGVYRSEFKVEGWGGKGVDDKPYLRVLRDGRIALSLPLLNQVRLYSSSGVLQATIAPTDEPLSRPYGMVETLDGKLWIVEGGANRVRQFPIP